MTRNQEIRLELRRGESTSKELAVILGRTPRDVQVGLWVLGKHGHVRHTGRYVANEGARASHLWELTPQGRMVTRFASRNTKRAADPKVHGA